MGIAFLVVAALLLVTSPWLYRVRKKRLQDLEEQLDRLEASIATTSKSLEVVESNVALLTASLKDDPMVPPVAEVTSLDTDLWSFWTNPSSVHLLNYGELSHFEHYQSMLDYGSPIARRPNIWISSGLAEYAAVLQDRLLSDDENGPSIYFHEEVKEKAMSYHGSDALRQQWLFRDLRDAVSVA